MTIPKRLEDVLSIDPEVMHGKPCFKGTLLPLRVFLDNMEEGSTIDEFVEDYPSIGRQEALAVVATLNPGGIRVVRHDDPD